MGTISKILMPDGTKLYHLQEKYPMTRLWKVCIRCEEHRSRLRKGRMSALKGSTGECHQSKATGQCSRGDSCSFRHGSNRVQEAQFKKCTNPVAWLLASSRVSTSHKRIGMQIRRKVRVQAHWGWRSVQEKDKEKWWKCGGFWSTNAPAEQERSELSGTGHFENSDTLQRLSQPMVEVETNEGATVNVHGLELFVTVETLKDTPAVLSLGKLCEWASGQKPHQTKNGRNVPTVRRQVHLLYRYRRARLKWQHKHSGIGKPVARSHRNQKNTEKNRDIVTGIGTSCEMCQKGWRISQKNRWTKECQHQASRDTPANTSHDSDSERPTKVLSRKHIIAHTHFPKVRNCNVCLRTNVTGAPCRKRTGEALPRAENVGDLITADHKVLSDNCESRNNHRYAVVVQYLATQWTQSYPCKTKTSQEKARMFLARSEKPKVIYTDNSMEFGNAREDLSWNHCTSTPHRSETNGIAERAALRVKEETSAVLLQSGLDENGGRNIQDLLSDGKTLTKGDLENHSKAQSYRLAPM